MLSRLQWRNLHTTSFVASIICRWKSRKYIVGEGENDIYLSIFSFSHNVFTSLCLNYMNKLMVCLNEVFFVSLRF